MWMQSLALWLTLMVVCVGVFLWGGDSYPMSTVWMTRAGGLLVILGAAGVLHGARGTGQRKIQIFAGAMMVYGVSHFIPAVEIRAILMLPILLAMFASLAGVPASFFRNGNPSAK